MGDLFFNGVATDVNRSLDSGGFQADGSYLLNDQHTLRAGVMVLQESLTSDTTTTVYPTNSSGAVSGAAFPIVQDSHQHATFFGVYLQDEWKIVPKLTLNFGARFDLYSSSFDKRKPGQSARQPDLPSDDQYHVARRVRAVLHAAATGKCAGDGRVAIQWHVESSPQ